MKKMTTFFLEQITIQRIDELQITNNIKVKSKVIRMAIDYLYNAMKNRTKECINMEMLIDKLKLTLDNLELDSKTRNELNETLESMNETMDEINNNFSQIDNLCKEHNIKNPMTYIPDI